MGEGKSAGQRLAGNNRRRIELPINYRFNHTTEKPLMVLLWLTVPHPPQPSLPENLKTLRGRIKKRCTFAVQLGAERRPKPTTIDTGNTPRGRHFAVRQSPIDEEEHGDGDGDGRHLTNDSCGRGRQGEGIPAEVGERPLPVAGVCLSEQGVCHAQKRGAQHN